ncbi:hypothetical protein DFJ73DRAFT_625571, partial [Zopfochytrium polystomum]
MAPATPPPAPSSELFGSLVGSYEESILSGRMSALPSRPILFVAEIGDGSIPADDRLRCPAHVCLEFSAYFYDLQSDETPSTPYVGCIDVEGLAGLIVSKEDAEKEKRKEARKLRKSGLKAATSHSEDEGEDVDTPEVKFRKKWVGGYRIPTKGQLQIIIKNPSRTAVKVFLIPYDFRDMPAGTKTFLRQKVSLVCPTNQPSSKSQTDGTPMEGTRPGGRKSTSSTSPVPIPHPRSIPPRLQPSASTHESSHCSSTVSRLRDAIHLQFYCTPKGRLYLTKSIRVVFSQRAPPDREDKLVVTCEGPTNPRYIPCD